MLKKKLIAVLLYVAALAADTHPISASADDTTIPGLEPVISRLAVVDAAGTIWTVELDGRSQPIPAIQGLGDIESLGVRRTGKDLLLYALSSTGTARVCYQFKDRKLRGQFLPPADHPSLVAQSESALNRKQVVIMGGVEVLYPDLMTTYKPHLAAITGPGLSGQLWTLDDTGTVSFVPRLRNGRILWQNAAPVFSYPGALTMTLGHSDDLWIITAPTADQASRLLLWQNGQGLRGNFTGYSFDQLRHVAVRDSILFGIDGNKLLRFTPDLHAGLLSWDVYAEFPLSLRDLTFVDKWTDTL
jgi:hypothetical protein